MNPETTPDKPALFDRPRNVRRLLGGFFAILGLLLVAEGFIQGHAHFTWERMPFFHATYGFVACVAVIFTAKALRRLLKRPATYYDGDGTETPPATASQGRRDR
jgi:hypothetical protein